MSELREVTRWRAERRRNNLPRRHRARRLPGMPPMDYEQLNWWRQPFAIDEAFCMGSLSAIVWPPDLSRHLQEECRPRARGQARGTRPLFEERRYRGGDWQLGREFLHLVNRGGQRR